MAFVLDCTECGSTVEIGRYERLCPVCEAPLSANALGERRSNRTVPFVRDWITRLRFSGGDFDKTAARAAGEIAFESARRGLRSSEVFDIARTRYYEEFVHGDDGDNGDRLPAA